MLKLYNDFKTQNPGGNWLCKEALFAYSPLDDSKKDNDIDNATRTVLYGHGQQTPEELLAAGHGLSAELSGEQPPAELSNDNDIDAVGHGQQRPGHKINDVFVYDTWEPLGVGVNVYYKDRYYRK
ncbi:hypothetical protein AGMMS50222_09250 [Endomicrobiia bacterium]|nr:hypothetical protein AGMMS49531_10760 [Endomicrobiia bacterium]GHT63929.1 hypothetical protein AGMMS49556_01180 [Endomicrobiia bacterium]GHT72047.1 hypothetical protein AGMMS49950_10010 [Endomicrobiia bacterium]GHT76536.1 hypothetical protein AGMMS50222_09250 [Endomicrobiia bacterium]